MGDFNSMPNSIALGFFKSIFPDQSKIQKDPDDEEFTEKVFERIVKESIKIFENFDHQLIKDLDLKNVYEDYKLHVENNGTNEEKEGFNFPDFSNFTESFKGFIDHIYLRKCDFDVVGLKLLPEIQDFDGVTRGCPYDDFPSDHLPIGVEVVPI